MVTAIEYRAMALQHAGKKDGQTTCAAVRQIRRHRREPQSEWSLELSSRRRRGRIQWSRSLERITTPPMARPCGITCTSVIWRPLTSKLSTTCSRTPPAPASIWAPVAVTRSVRSFSAVEGISGRTVPVFEGPRRAGDPPALIADPQLGRSVLGWTPRRSDLSTIVLTAWQWHQKNAPQAISAAASRAGMRVASAKAAPPNVL
jgi:hypothetical protein